jgi:hypothetical protein
MLVCGGMEDHAGSEVEADLLESLVVSDVGDDGFEVDVGVACAELALEVEERVFGLLEHDDLRRSEACDLSAEF